MAGERVLCIANADEERVARIAEPLKDHPIRAGDGSKVAINPPADLRCPMAHAVADFVRDVQAGSTRLVSVNRTGEAAGASPEPMPGPASRVSTRLPWKLSGPGSSSLPRSMAGRFRSITP